MRRFFGIFLSAALFTFGTTVGASPTVGAQDDWAEAATFALTKIRYSPGTILVVNQSVPDAAVKALRGLGPVISSEELPEQDEYIIPPGPYMLIRKFDVQNGVFEFNETTGTIKKGMMGNCGETEIVTMRRNSDGAWELARPMELIDC